MDDLLLDKNSWVANEMKLDENGNWVKGDEVPISKVELIEKDKILFTIDEKIFPIYVKPLGSQCTIKTRAEIEREFENIAKKRREYHKRVNNLIIDALLNLNDEKPTE